MKAHLLGCAACGAPLEVPVGAAAVTCEFCGANSRIEAAAGAAPTPAVAEVDEAWRRKRAILLRERDRRGSVPTRARALGPGLVALGLFVAGALNLGGRLDRGLALLGFGLVFALAAGLELRRLRRYARERRAFATARRALLERGERP